MHERQGEKIDHCEGCFKDSLERNKAGVKETRVRKHCTSQMREHEVIDEDCSRWRIRYGEEGT